MADSPEPTAKSAEQAGTGAAAEAKPAVAPAPSATCAAPTEIEKPAAPQPAAKNKTAARARHAARVTRAAAAPAAVETTKSRLSVSELKEKIMATAQKNSGTNDFSKPIVDAFGEFQTRAKAAYDKGSEVAAEVTELTKGNVEAFVESGKIFAAGAQSLGKSYVEEARSAYETMTADAKELAAVKSPAELFQLQGKILRRNFDAFVATTAKNSEAAFQLANDAFAPLSGRVTVAAEKLTKVA